MSNNRVNVSCQPEVHFGELVPSINLYFRFFNDTDDPIVMSNLNYNIFLDSFGVRNTYIGSGSIQTQGTRDGSLNYWTIQSQSEYSCSSIFELGFTKLNLIENLRKKDKQNRRTSNMRLKIEFQGKLIKSVPNLVGKEESDKNIPLSFGCDIPKIEIHESQWINWLNGWGRDIKSFEISSDLENIIQGLKQDWKITDNNDVILRIIHYAGLFEKDPSPTREFLYNSIDDDLIKIKIEDMIDRAEEKILISGWIDTLLLRNLKEKTIDNFEIKIITKKPDGKSNTQIKETYPKLIEFAEVRRNSKMHSRFIIIDNKEALFWSGDLSSNCLTMNFEAGIWTNEQYFIKSIENYFNKVWKSEDSINVNEEIKKSIKKESKKQK
jgi:sugar-specific transcriptional regulator TrmB